MKITWFLSRDIDDCERCDDLIGIGDECAWIPGGEDGDGELVCVDCGEDADTEARGAVA